MRSIPLPPPPAATPAGAAVHPTLRWDGVPWDHPRPPERIVAVGDIQGDLRALAAILAAASLVDAGGRWQGARQHLVLLGDLVGGHGDSRLAVDWVRRLEREARRAGGAVHALLGNHDLLPARGDVSRWTRRERRLWRRHPPPGAPGPAAKDAFRGDSDLARWLAGRNALVRIGATLFAHAGVDAWLSSAAPGDVNATVRAWIAHWQGRGPRPPEDTCWTVGVPGMARDSALARGPLWHRGFKPDGARRPRGGPRREDLAQWLRAVGADRLVLGHAPVDGGEILLRHPYYEDLVVLADTRIGDRERGRLRALEITSSGLRSLRAATTQRDPAVRERELARLRAAGETRPAARRWWRRLWRALRRLCGARQP